MKTKGKKIWLGLSIFIILIGAVSLFLFSRYQKEKRLREYERELYYDLYRHGFQLLEEQIAYYIVENYSGVSKVEFSPIFISGGGTNTFLVLDVVTRVYDNNGNSAILAGEYDNVFYSTFGTVGSISLSIATGGDHIVELNNSANGEKIDVSKYVHLPPEGKVKSITIIDQMIDWQTKNSYLLNIKKDMTGSPDADIVYNLEIRKGDWAAWR